MPEIIRKRKQLSLTEGKKKRRKRGTGELFEDCISNGYIQFFQICRHTTRVGNCGTFTMESYVTRNADLASVGSTKRVNSLLLNDFRNRIIPSTAQYRSVYGQPKDKPSNELPRYSIFESAQFIYRKKGDAHATLALPLQNIASSFESGLMDEWEPLLAYEPQAVEHYVQQSIEKEEDTPIDGVIGISDEAAKQFTNISFEEACAAQLRANAEQCEEGAQLVPEGCDDDSAHSLSTECNEEAQLAAANYEVHDYVEHYVRKMDEELSMIVQHELDCLDDFEPEEEEVDAAFLEFTNFDGLIECST